MKRNLKIKGICALVIASSIVMLCACGKTVLKQDHVQITVTEPESVQQGEKEKLEWIEVGSLTDVEDLRNGWDEAFETSGTTGNKSGTLYTTPEGNSDNNITLQIVVHNEDVYRVFSLNYYDDGSEVTQEKLLEAIKSEYTDLEDEDDQTIVAMGINGYFNIIEDSEPGYSNPHETLTRGEVMAGTMRSSTPVSTNAEEDKDFTSAVGDSEYNLYAQELDGTCFVSTKDGSLNKETYNSTMTRGEVVYMLMQTYKSEELKNVDLDQEYYAVTFTDATNGGDIASDQKLDDKEQASRVMKYMLEHPEDGVDEDMYRALVLAYTEGIIDTETRWDEGITKAEFIEMLVKTLRADTSVKYFGNYPSDEALLIDDSSNAEYSTGEIGYGCMQECEQSEMYPFGQKNDVAMAAWEKYYSDFSLYGTENDPRTVDISIAYTGYSDDAIVTTKTDKGYTCGVDKFTGKVYYDGMITPAGDTSWSCPDEETYNQGAQYVRENNIEGRFMTYAEMQDCYGVPVN